MRGDNSSSEDEHPVPKDLDYYKGFAKSGIN
jgi:hypothetical protein